MKKFSFLEGKALVIAVEPMDRAMSICQISGPLPPVEKVQTEKKYTGADGRLHQHVIVYFANRIKVVINFDGTPFGGNKIHWKAAHSDTLVNGRCILELADAGLR